MTPRYFDPDFPRTPIVLDHWIHVHGGRYVLAHWSKGAWHGPIQFRVQGTTHDATVIARDLSTIAATPAVQTYAHHSSAIRAAVRVYGWVRCK